MNEDIAVSVCCFVYNHKNFIRRSLEGFLMQKTNFKYEILIHDDASVDGTREILEEYADKYPDKIKLFTEEENQFSKVKNFAYLDRWIVENAVGKYIAYCEGDDIWIYPNKLQYQYDLMESNDNIMLCGHNTLKLNVTSGESELQIKGLKEGIIDVEEVFFGRCGILPTASFFLKKEIMDNFPDFYYDAKVGDNWTRLISLYCGDLYYIDEVWSVRNFMHKSSWNYIMKNDKEYALDVSIGESDTFCEFNKWTNFVFEKYVIEKIRMNFLWGLSMWLPEVFFEDDVIQMKEKMLKKVNRENINILNEVIREKLECSRDYVDISVKQFIEECTKKHGTLYIYGAGKEAAELFIRLRLKNILIEGFVVSLGHKISTDYMGVPVKEWNELKNKNENIYVILGLNKNNTCQVIESVCNYNCNVLYRDEITWEWEANIRKKDMKHENM